MKFRQLYDPKMQATFTVDAKSLSFEISSDDLRAKTRLKAYHLALLLALFKEHPKFVSYDRIKEILTGNQLACPDSTRLHRKISELRSRLEKIDPRLKGFIRNTRGIGYSLPLYLKDPSFAAPSSKKTLKNKNIQKALEQLHDLIEESLEMTLECPIIKLDSLFILKRSFAHSSIEQMLLRFLKAKEEIFTQLKRQEADFFFLRVEFMLAKLKTYIALVRVSEFSITKEQWLDWHEHEARLILDELADLLSLAGS